MEIIWPKSFHFIGRTHPDGLEVSAEELLSHAASVAEMLASRGVGPGDRIALWLSDGIEQLASVFGCWSVGATFCVLPSFAGRTATDRSRARVENILTILKPKLLIQGEGFQLPDAISGLAETIVLDLDALPNAPSRDPLSAIEARADDDMAFVQFTSGSTGGNARGAVVRFGQLKANLDALTKRVGLTEQAFLLLRQPQPFGVKDRRAKSAQRVTTGIHSAFSATSAEQNRRASLRSANPMARSR